MTLHDFLLQVLAGINLLDEVQRLQASMGAQIDALRGTDSSSASWAKDLEQLSQVYDDISEKVVTLSETIAIFSQEELDER
jgi:hypothetical protein